MGEMCGRTQVVDDPHFFDDIQPDFWFNKPQLLLHILRLCLFQFSARARPGQSKGLRVSHSESVLYGAFV